MKDKTFTIRELDGPGIHFNMFQLDPAVIRAQRQAELENIAKYRAQRLASYKKWSDPIEGPKWREEIKKEEQECRKELDKISADLIAVRTRPKNEPFPFEMKPLLKPTTQSAVTQTKWTRIKSWFARIFRTSSKAS